MGSGLCRSTDGKPRAAGVDGLYRQIVFNYAKQWTRSNKRPKRDKTNTKHNKRNMPTISGPFPADPDRLEGDKWRYVILTRLDTESPPERPPRTKRRRRSQHQHKQHHEPEHREHEEHQQCQQHRQHQHQHDGDASTDGGADVGGLWNSMRRRRRRLQRRSSHGPARAPPPPPPRPRRRRARGPAPSMATAEAAAHLMELIASTAFRAYVCGAGRVPRPAADRSLTWPGDDGGTHEPPPRPAAKTAVRLDRRNGLFASVGRVTAMADGLLSSR